MGAAEAESKQLAEVTAQRDMYKTALVKLAGKVLCLAAFKIQDPKGLEIAIGELKFTCPELANECIAEGERIIDLAE